MTKKKILETMNKNLKDSNKKPKYQSKFKI